MLYKKNSEKLLSCINNYLDDLNAIVSDKIDGIMLPKAHVSDIKELGNILTELENKKSLTKKIKIIPIVELAESLLEVETMVFLDRVDGILLGAEDFSSDLEVVRTKEGEEIFYARSKIAVACCAAKIDAIDTPFTDTKDNEGLEKDCLKAIKLGMKAKSCIHPNQIETVNEINELMKELNLGIVQQVCQNLLLERVSVRDLRTILEVLSLQIKVSNSPDYLTEQVRQALARSICKQNLSDSGDLLAVTLLLMLYFHLSIPLNFL